MDTAAIIYSRTVLWSNASVRTRAQAVYADGLSSSKAKSSGFCQTQSRR